MTTVTTSAPEVIGAGDQPLAPGQRVGEYEIIALLGKGGFGTVYRAHQPLIGKQVAIKVLARRYSADADMVSRFVSEARAVNQIRHRNIIDIFSFGTLEDGRHYYVMEYLDGEPFDQYLAQVGPVPLAEALPILRALGLALDAAHGKGIAHRDLKPENVFLARDSDGSAFPKLLDFGIAKLLTPDEDVRHRTGTGVPMGTPYYMSPEQCRGREVDHRTDIYSFGIVAYRVLTGALPFEGADYLELLSKQASEEPVPPSQRVPELPASVDEAIAWMMKKDRAQRPPTVLAGVAALDPSSVTPAPLRRSRPSIAPDAAALAQTIATPVTTSPMRRRRGPPRLVLVGLPLLSIGAVVIAIVALKRGGEAKQDPPAPPAPPPVAVAQPSPPPPPVPIDASIADAPPAHVKLTVEGLPANATVTLDGVPLVAVAPGVFEVKPGTASREVIVRSGRKVGRQQVTLDTDRRIHPVLTAPARVPTTVTPPPHDPNSTEDPFK